MGLPSLFTSQRAITAHQPLASGTPRGFARLLTERSVSTSVPEFARLFAGESWIRTPSSVSMDELGSRRGAMDLLMASAIRNRKFVDSLLEGDGL
jgi:hypothetical protein